VAANDYKKYKCCFNYSHEIVVLYEWAWSGRQAKNFAMRKLAKKHGVHPACLFALFDGSRDNFEIERVETKTKIADKERSV